jgi:Anti-sigma factor NepR
MTDKKRSLTEMPSDAIGDARPVTPGRVDVKGPALPPEVQGQIGKQLRQVYGQLLSEPLPDKFSKLLEQLGKPERDQ